MFLVLFTSGTGEKKIKIKAPSGKQCEVTEKMYAQLKNEQGLDDEAIVAQILAATAEAKAGYPSPPSTYYGASSTSTFQEDYFRTQRDRYISERYTDRYSQRYSTDEDPPRTNDSSARSSSVLEGGGNSSFFGRFYQESRGSSSEEEDYDLLRGETTIPPTIPHEDYETTINQEREAFLRGADRATSRRVEDDQQRRAGTAGAESRKRTTNFLFSRDSASDGSSELPIGRGGPPSYRSGRRKPRNNSRSFHFMPDSDDGAPAGKKSPAGAGGKSAGSGKSKSGQSWSHGTGLIILPQTFRNTDFHQVLSKGGITCSTRIPLLHKHGICVLSRRKK